MCSMWKWDYSTFLRPPLFLGCYLFTMPAAVSAIDKELYSSEDGFNALPLRFC